MAFKMKNEFKIGLLVSIAIVCLILGYNFLRGRGLFSNEDKYYAFYDNITGLQKSAMVTFEGVQVGKVIDINLQPDRRIRVTIGLTNKDFSIPVGSKAQLLSDNMLAGTKVIALQLSNNSNKLSPGDTLPSLASAGLLDGVSEQMGPLFNTVNHTVTSIDTLINSVNDVVNTQTKQHLDRTFAALDATMADLAKLSNALNAQTANLSAVMTNLNSVTGNLAKSNTQVSAILNNAEIATNKISQAKIQESFDNIEAATKSIQNTLKQIENSDGTLGLLIRDPKLYTNLNNALRSVDTVLSDLKQRPSRYINVSVFGRKAAQ